MNFLKKLGSILLKATEIAVGFGPIIASAVPSVNTIATKITGELEQLAQVIMTVEAAGQAIGTPGPDKARMAAPLIAQAVLQSSLMVGKTIADPVLFQKATSALGGDLADLLNSLKPDIQTESKT